jgi:hypothetical protein
MRTFAWTCPSKSSSHPRPVHSSPSQPRESCNAGAMAKKTADVRQLTLFDSGLDAPSSPRSLPGRRRSLAKPEPDIIRPERQSRALLAAPVRLREVESDGREPVAFEKASYELYLVRKTEARSHTTTGTILLVVLLFAAVLRIAPQEALFGIVKFSGLPLFYVIGALGWATVLYLAFALKSAAHAAQKKRQCGLFYQRVLRFSDSRLAILSEPVLAILYVFYMIGGIALVFIVAREEMFALVWHIITGILNIFRIGPWTANLP